MSTEAIKLKEQQVEDLKTKINDSASVVVIKNNGLLVSEMSELRTQLREEDVELSVIKNNISSRAFKAANLDAEELFVGPTAIAFSKEDVTSAARILNNFSKKVETLELIGGTFDGSMATLDEIKELASLPGKEGLLSMLLSVLEAPVRGLAQVTSQIAEQAPAEDTPAEAKEEPKVEESANEETPDSTVEATEETNDEEEKTTTEEQPTEEVKAVEEKVEEAPVEDAPASEEVEATKEESKEDSE
ncbi:MAG: 50S ribosomal protein L10 [Mycoplasmatales bacterium]